MRYLELRIAVMEAEGVLRSCNHLFIYLFISVVTIERVV